ncbi:flagellar hook-length control protein FliK, partial [Roseovarius sp. MMSF_3281]|uniref:flagellar hook-length control protein FliK n=1 Tax=Roseovarius sp. MMSF_3281 TaxID=3046694 RepID=UPI00273FF17D
SAPTIPGEDTGRGAAPLETALAEMRLAPDTAPRPGISPSHHMPQTAELPRHIAQQMAEALQRAGGTERGVDLLLNPAELGRVRINLSPGEAGLTVQIMADRPETLDLMRRHIDLLAQDFQSIGFEASSFAFEQSHDDTPKGGGPRDIPHPRDTGQDSPQTPAPPQVTVLADRVDIRL